MNKPKYVLLSKEEVQKHFDDLKGWQTEAGMLSKLYKFSSYTDGLVFASAVGWIAEGLKHHPEILVGYQKVMVATTTHDVEGLTEYDFKLARYIDNYLSGTL